MPASFNMSTTINIEISQYLVDTRSLWTQASKTKDLEHVVSLLLDSTHSPIHH